MEYLIYQIIEHLRKEMPELLTIDEDYGQLENLADEEQDMYPLTFPAVLIEAPETEWSDIATGSQKGNCTIRIRLILDCYDDTHAGSTTTYRILERHKLCKRLHNLLQTFIPEPEVAGVPTPPATVPDASASGLIRTHSKFFTWSYGIKVYESTYTCVATDIMETKAIPVGRPKVAISIVKKL